MVIPALHKKKAFLLNFFLFFNFFSFFFFSSVPEGWERTIGVKDGDPFPAQEKSLFSFKLFFFLSFSFFCFWQVHTHTHTHTHKSKLVPVFSTPHRKHWHSETQGRKKERWSLKRKRTTKKMLLKKNLSAARAISVGFSPKMTKKTQQSRRLRRADSLLCFKFTKNQFR